MPTLFPRAIVALEIATLVIAALTVVGLTACASTPEVAKPGFHTEIRDGRLWVFRQGSKDVEDFKKHGEPEKQVTRIGAGPKGMTIKSSDGAVIDEYLAAK
jgi:hypothetical protein